MATQVRKMVNKWQRKLRRSGKSYTSLDSGSSVSTCPSDLEEFYQRDEKAQGEEEREGGMIVYVGRDKRRYVVRARHVSHPLFKTFMERSSVSVEEVVVACEVVMFEHLLWMLENYDPAELHADGINELLDLVLMILQLSSSGVLFQAPGTYSTTWSPGKSFTVSRTPPFFASIQRHAFHAKLRCRGRGVSSPQGVGDGGGGGGGSCRGFRGGGRDGENDPPPPNKGRWWRVFCCAAAGFLLIRVSKAAAHVSTSQVDASGEETKISKKAVWQVKEGKWIRYVLDESRNEFVVDATKPSEEEAMEYERQCCVAEEESDSEKTDRTRTKASGKVGTDEFVNWCVDVVKTTMLPVGYPKTVSEDYTEYTLWRMGQVIASQISGVLTTQALLYAVGLGKGAIPTAAAINWVLKDGIGYLSKIVLSKYGRHFDVHPKSWRLLSDLMEDAANGLELLTPAFPQLFVPLTAVAGAGKSAAGLIQAATRSCFYAGFATQHNFAEVIAKGEAQGMLSKSLGIALGIGISSKVGSSGSLLVLTFAAVTAAHILCNLKSYEAVQLHTLNTYRTALIMSEFIRRGEIPSVKDVNSVEPILLMNLWFRNKDEVSISEEAKQAAEDIERNLQLGVSFGDAISNKETAERLFELYESEKYILTLGEKGNYKVVLKKLAAQSDMLRAVIHASYLRHALKSADSSVVSLEEILKLSYLEMHENFRDLTQSLRAAGWFPEGLVARPASNRTCA